jgi:hypothetical protein
LNRQAAKTPREEEEDIGVFGAATQLTDEISLKILFLN